MKKLESKNEFTIKEKYLDSQQVVGKTNHAPVVLCVDVLYEGIDDSLMFIQYRNDYVIRW